jgi:acyl-coenzyme A synthetase/AMP-(fatty) acid ligase
MTVYYINAGAHRTPDKTALIHNDRRLSYAQFARLIAAARGRLAAEALPAGGVTAILSQSLLTSWVLSAAARSLGRTTVCVSHVGRIGELALSNLTAVVMADDEPRFLADRAALPPVPLVVVASGIVHAAEGLDADLELPETGPLGDHILYTSGTTGAYKKVLVEASKQRARDGARAGVSEFDADTVFHAVDNGLWTGIGFKSPSAVWLSGGAVIVDQTEARYANFLRYDPTYAQTLPENLRAICEARGPDAQPSATLHLRCGGSLVPLALAERAVTRVAKRLTVGFSATELNAVVMLSTFREPDDLLWLRPITGQIEIVDDEGRDVGADVEGVFRIRLTALDSKGYLDNPQATARAFRDGCFYTGDLAVRRADGRVRILGRADDVLNVKGQKLAVGPIEENLQRGLGVEELCIFLGLARDGVEELVVAIRSKDPVDKADVLTRLGPSKIFDRVRVEVFPEFPRTQAGLSKIKRTELRRWVFPD